MDMKRILQAMDGVATKPVAGANDMSKFLRVIREAEQVPPMPDVTGLQAGQPKDLGNGEKVTLNNDGTVSYDGGWGTYIYNAQGQHIKTQSPTFSGYSQTTDPTGKVTQQNYQQGPLSLQTGQQGTTAKYQLGSQALQTQINEGANPHKVSLPVQMAMQHYQQTEEKKPYKHSTLITRYFAEAEEAKKEQEENRKQLIRQYASIIAERVMMRESVDKEEVIAKRKAIQELEKDNKYTTANRKRSLHKHSSSLSAVEKNLDERSVSQAQARTMAAAAHNPEFAKKVGIKQSVAKEFNQADKGKKLKTLPKRVKKGKPVNEHEAGWERHGMAGVGLQGNIDEDPIPRPIKPKKKTSVCRTGQTQTGMQTKNGKQVPKCSVTGLK